MISLTRGISTRRNQTVAGRMAAARRGSQRGERPAEGTEFHSRKTDAFWSSTARQRDAVNSAVLRI